MSETRTSDSSELPPGLTAPWKRIVGSTLGFRTHLVELRDGELLMSVLSARCVAEVRHLAPALIGNCHSLGAHVDTIRCILA